MISFIIRIFRMLIVIVFFLMFTPTMWFLIKNYYSNMMSPKTYIGVVKLPQNIEEGNKIIKDIKNLCKSAEIKAIILKCDSNGGNPGACQAIFRDIIEIQKVYKKIIVAYAEKEVLAGAFLIAKACNDMIVNENTTIGHFFDYSSYNIDDHKLYEEVYKKSLLSLYPIELHEKISELKRGEVMIAQEAYNKKIINHIGSSYDVEQLIRTKTIVQGRIEEVNGSLLEHFIAYTTDILTKLITSVKKAWNDV